MIRKRLVLTLALACVSLVGCAARQSTITNLPAGVTQAQVQSWDSAVANLHAIAIANSNLRVAVIQLHATLGTNGQPVLPSGQVYVDILTAIGRIDQAENAASSFLSTVPNNWNQSISAQIGSYTGAISAALQTLTNEGTLAVKGTAAQNQVSQFIGNIAAAIKIIASLA